jgi:hypothetical protein
LEGTGFEKLQMVHTHVAVLAGGGSTGDTRGGPSGCWAGEEVLLREGLPARPGDRGWKMARFVGFGIRVILADDLRKPPYEYLISAFIWRGVGVSEGAYIELEALHILEIQGNRVLPRLSLVNIAYPVRGQVDLPILVVWQLVFPG